MHLRNRSGLATADALLREENTAEEIRLAIENGELRPLSPGLAATPLLRADELAAINDGWRPTCISSAAAHGLWVPEATDRRLHAYRPRTPRKEAPAAVVPHRWHDAWPESDATASVPQLLGDAIRCQDLETCVVLADSALNMGLLTSDDWADIVAGAPLQYRRVLGRAVDTADSGSETRVRLGLQAARVPVEAQVAIDGVGTVDLCVKGRWVIECDSRRHHSAEADYARDRRRDLRLHALGYVVTRLSYPQIWYDWDRTLVALLAMFRRLRNRPRRPLAA
jgi:very-short-patch-repair endonuclease